MRIDPKESLEAVADRQIRCRISLLELALLLLLAPLGAATWTALLGAGLGDFSPAVALSAAVLALLAVVILKASVLRQGRIDAAWRWDLLALVLLLIFAWNGRNAGSPWPAYLDDSWYLNTGVRIEREASLDFHEPALGLLDGPERRLVSATFADQVQAGLPFPNSQDRGFHAQVFTVRGLDGDPPARLGPYHPPFFASSVALASRLFGPGGASSAVLPWTWAWLLAVAVLARLVYGPRAAPLALALAGSGPLAAYYGSLPFAEMAAGALFLGGLAALTRLAERDGPAPRLAALAGLGLGLSVLAKIDLLPALGFCLFWWILSRRPALAALAARQPSSTPQPQPPTPISLPSTPLPPPPSPPPPIRREALALILGLGLPLAQLAWLATGASQLYLSLNLSGVLRLAEAHWPVLAGLAAVAALAVLAWRLRPASRRPGLEPMARGLGMLLLGLLVAESLRGLLAPGTEPPGMLAVLAWAITPLALWAGVAGLLLALDSARHRRLPTLWLACTALPLVLAAPLVTRSLSSLYSARRLLPLALPLVLVYAAGAALSLRSDQRSPRSIETMLRAGLPALGSLLVILAAWQSAAPFAGAGGGAFAGGPALAAGLARNCEPEAILLFASTLDGNAAGRLAAATASLEDRSVAVIGSPAVDPEALDRLLTTWLAAGRGVCYVTEEGRALPELKAHRLNLLDSVSIVSRAPAPDPALPPRMAPLPIALEILAVEPMEP